MTAIEREYQVILDRRRIARRGLIPATCLTKASTKF